MAGRSMSEREKDRVAAMVLRVVEEVTRAAQQKPPPGPESANVWLPKQDARLLRR
jgi:hypothetical protein